MIYESYSTDPYYGLSTIMLNNQMRFVIIILLSIIIPKILLCQPRVKDTDYGKVVGISDGDTITILVNNNVQEKIRPHGIECPEKAQDFGQAAKNKLSALIFSQTVLIKRTDRDRYGRTIALVYDTLNRCITRTLASTYFSLRHPTQYRRSYGLNSKGINSLGSA